MFQESMVDTDMEHSEQGEDANPESTSNIAEEFTAVEPTYTDKSVQTDAILADTLLNKELYELRQSITQYRFTTEAFQHNNKKTLYFTGIPTFAALNSIFSRLIEPYIKITPRSAIQDKFTQFIITLMKLRLNLDFTLLSYLFNVSVQTISRIFYSIVRILYFRLKKFIMWPPRELLIKSMPQCFKDAFGSRVTVIIDCFEINIEKSKHLEAQCTTWSSYKSHNTVKILIGITPVGSISFISQGYGGRISDKQITEECGILENLQPNDLILADRGFLIHDSVGLRLATVKMPAFLKGKKQLDPLEIEETRNIEHVRIHVERVIGVLKQKYTILHNILPIYLMKRKADDIAVIDQIVSVCAALINLCPSIVSVD